jgi:hypothetical protein
MPDRPMSARAAPVTIVNLFGKCRQVFLAENARKLVFFRFRFSSFGYLCTPKYFIVVTQHDSVFPVVV